METKLRRLLTLPTDCGEFFDLVHEIIMGGTTAQQKTAMRLLDKSIGNDEVPITTAMIRDYITVHEETT